MLQAHAPLVRELPDAAWFDVVMMQGDLRLTLERGRGHRDIASMFRALSEMPAAPHREPLGSSSA